MAMGLNYYTAYACDKRVGFLNNEFYTPMYDSDYLLAVILNNDVLQYIYPKKSRFGYYVDEMPFYFESTEPRLVYIYDYRAIDNKAFSGFRKAMFPNSIVNDNTRKSSVQVDVNTLTKKLAFNTRISLRGQYSTLCRGNYLYDYKDETVNELYSKKIWELNDKYVLENNKTVIKDKNFPFPTTVSAKYSFDNLLTVDNDIYSIDMKNWFNHIIYLSFNPRNRQLDFYPDFMGSDIYVYFLKFDRDIELIDSLKVVNINNNLGKYIFNIEKINERTVKISSYFEVYSGMVN